MSLIIKKNTTFKIPRTGSGAPTIYKVAIFGAGSIGASREYLYDGVLNGQPKYKAEESGVGFWNIFFNGYDWSLDFEGGDAYYYGTTQINWSFGEIGDTPNPSATASYSQTSYIQTVVLAGGDPDQSGTYTWNGTTFVNGKPRYVGPLKSNAPTNNSIQFSGFEYILNGYYPAGEEMIDQSVSIDLATNWSEADCVTAPTVSSIIYTA